MQRQTKLQILLQACPQCHHTTITHDPRRAETICRTCGLVLAGPPVHGIHYPGVTLITQTIRIGDTVQRWTQQTKP